MSHLFRHPVVISCTGLMGLIQSNGSQDIIEPCLPGYYEEYDISKTGKVTPVAHRQFHCFENLPMWRDIKGYHHPNEGMDRPTLG